jgi:leucine dehydrogenase
MMEFDVKNHVVNDGPITNMASTGHEQVIFCQDATTGLKAIIGIHNTVLGPALGGTRMWSYSDEAAALEDVLRLSRGMTFKAAAAGLNLGGGKAVIIGDSRTQKSEAMLRRFGKFVDTLGGRYITAEDVGMNTRDMEVINYETDHVTGLPEYLGGSGDPSPVTAYGVYMGMKASARFLWGNDSLAGKKIAVQGAGNVGMYLVDNLVKEGAQIFIADIYEDRLREVSKNHTVEVVDPATIYDLNIDIYAPCALGGTLNHETIDRLKCSIVAGGANNQLLDEVAHSKMLMEKGIVYAPDFLINAGGLMSVYSEIMGYSKEAALKKAENIYDNTLEILKFAAEQKIPVSDAAMKFAQNRIDSIAKLNAIL